MIVIFLIILLPVLVLGQKQQVAVGNATRSVIKIEGVDIAPRVQKKVSLRVIDGVADFKVQYFNENLVLTEIELSRPVLNGRIKIENFEDMTEGQNQRAARAVIAAQENNQTSQSSQTPIEILQTPVQTNPGDWWSYVNIRPENKLQGYSIFVPVEPFRGLALKPNQESAQTITLRTGEIIFPVFLAAEEGVDTETGVKFSWAIVNKIVTEGQENFQIRPQDVMEANTGKIVRKRMISRLNFDFIISEGASKGKVVSPQRPLKLDMYVGWNIIPIQFKDSRGLPTQAILIILVNDAPGNVFARGKSSADNISVNRDNIIITNNLR